MDQPPAIVIEAPDVCADAARAGVALRDALGASVAPAAGWRLRVSSEAHGPRVLVKATLDDERGAGVAHRDLDVARGERCGSVVDAVGVWASMVLDVEHDRKRARMAARKKPPVVTVADQAAWPPPSPPTPVNDEAAPILDHPEGRRTVELGGAGLLMSGVGVTAVSPFVGGDVSLTAETGKGIFVRPSLLWATSLGQHAGYYGLRVDVCVRLPGNYIERHGLQLDTCLSTEIAGLDEITGDQHATQVLFAPGASLGLRGELASNLSVDVRGLAGFDVGHTGAEPANLLALRTEVGLTWRVR